jgi:hypothetical protein
VDGIYGLTIGEARYVSVCMLFFPLEVALRFLWHALFLEHALWHALFLEHALWYGLRICQVADARFFPSFYCTEWVTIP